MVMAALDHWYTFRVIETEPLKVECTKWEDGGPVETYRIDPDNQSPSGGCSCPAWTTNCKHRLALEAARADGKLWEAWKWIWRQRKVEGKNLLVPVPADDIKSIEELGLA